MSERDVLTQTQRERERCREGQTRRERQTNAKRVIGNIYTE